MLLKTYFFDIVQVSANDMLSTFQKGDVLLIKKQKSGFRHNDIVYFKFPGNDTSRNKFYCIQRLCGLPGDSLEIKDKILFINGKALNDSATCRYNFYLKLTAHPDSMYFIKRNLFEGGLLSEELDYSFSLTKAQADSLRSDSLVKNVELKLEKPAAFDETIFPGSTSLNWNRDQFGKLYLPVKNQVLRIDTANMVIYSKLISEFEHNELEIRKDSIFINGKYSTTYTVQYDYYFTMGDNRDNAIDCRTWGFIPSYLLRGKLFVVLKRSTR